MKTKQNKLNSAAQTSTKKNKEIQELQKSWDEATKKLKKSKNKEDQMYAKFLETHYIHPETGMITSKIRWGSHVVSCGPNEIK